MIVLGARSFPPKEIKMSISKLPHSGSICKVNDPDCAYNGRNVRICYLFGLGKYATVNVVDAPIGFCIDIDKLIIVDGLEVSI